MAKSARSRRNQQIASIVISVIVVVSMGLSLVVALTPGNIQQPPPATDTRIYITPLVLPTPTPTAAATPSPMP